MKRKIFSVLLVLMLMLSFGLAAPVMAEEPPEPIEFHVGPTGGVAEWSTEEAYSGDYSVKLAIGVPYVDESDYGEGRLIMPMGELPLDAITSFSIYWMANGASGLPYPYFALDTDEIPGADTWVIWNVGPANDTEGATGWAQWDLATSPDSWHIATIAGPYIDTGTWAEIKSNIGTDAEVLSIRVAIGYGSTSLTEPVFIDDIEVNGTIYNLEPEGGVTVETEVVEDVIQIGLSTTLLDFGKLRRGESSERSVTITSGSNMGIVVTASVESAFYIDNLTIDGFSMTAEPPWEVAMVEGGTVHEAALVVFIPSGYPIGQYTGTIIFWAEAVE